LFIDSYKKNNPYIYISLSLSANQIMSRKYSAWASNQPVINIDSSMMKLTTITGNEQEQCK